MNLLPNNSFSFAQDKGDTSARGLSCAWLLLLGAFLTAVGGCDPDIQDNDPINLGDSDSQIVFNNAIANLNELEGRIDHGRERYVPRKGKDGKPITSNVVLVDPEFYGNQFTILKAKNANFKTHGVRAQNKAKGQPGDIVHYIFQKELSELRLIGQDEMKFPLKMKIIEVIDENTLRIEGGLPGTLDKEYLIEFPQRLEVWRRSFERVLKTQNRLQSWVRTGKLHSVRAGNGQSELFWEPSPAEESIKQIVNRLNQWLVEQPDPGNWQPDPLVKTLSPKLKQLPQYKNLAKKEFVYYDGRLLQEAVWTRDIANSIRVGNDSYPGVENHPHLQQVYALFDWTVRNIQLEKLETRNGLRFRPWQTLLYGRGTAEERAWVLMLLARQKGLDVVMLAMQDPEKPNQLKPWTAALVQSNKDTGGVTLYLFDTRLGLPIPGPDGKGIATLDQVVQDESLLRQLDIQSDPPALDRPYPVKASDLKNLVALVEGSPNSLSWRMGIIESQLTGALIGQYRIMLTAAPSRLAKQLKLSKNIVETRLWYLPGETLHQQMNLNLEDRKFFEKQYRVFPSRAILWKGRMLQFKGAFDDQKMSENDDDKIASKREGAKHFLMNCRITNEAIRASSLVDKHKQLLHKAKQCASLWLGTILYEQLQYEEAEAWFERLIHNYPKSQLIHGAKYNLARTFEARGDKYKKERAFEKARKQFQKAIELYESDTKTLQYDGNQLRARRLKSALAAEPAPQ